MSQFIVTQPVTSYLHDMLIDLANDQQLNDLVVNYCVRTHNKLPIDIKYNNDGEDDGYYTCEWKGTKFRGVSCSDTKKALNSMYSKILGHIVRHEFSRAADTSLNN